MSTKHVIMALLDIKPMSGYDLAQSVKISINSLWSATYSQIYPTLHKLEKAGMVTSKTEPGSKHRDRIEYSLTDAGRDELTRWIHQPVQYLPFRDPFKLWASNLDKIDPFVVFQNIAHHIDLHRDRVGYLTQIASSIDDGSHPLIQVREERLPEEAFDRLKRARSFVFQELAQQAQAEVDSGWRAWAFAQEMYPDFRPKIVPKMK